MSADTLLVCGKSIMLECHRKQGDGSSSESKGSHWTSRPKRPSKNIAGKDLLAEEKVGSGFAA